MYSKYERRTDTRTYDDRRKLYEGGWDVLYAELLEKTWKEKMDEWTGRAKGGFRLKMINLTPPLLQPSFPNGLERGPERKLASPSLLMTRTRPVETPRPEPPTRRRRRRRRKRRRRSRLSTRSLSSSEDYKKSRQIAG